MHASIYMIEKELLHHKIITRLPLFLLVFSVILIALIAVNSNADVEITLKGINDIGTLNIQQGLSAIISFAAALVSYLLSILYLSKAMSKERQEGSLPFWRSMPVSDLLTHAVKLAFALLIIPFICSMLVLSAELLLWLISLFNPHQINNLLGEISLFSAVQNYLNFLLHMLMVGIALLPFACLMFAVSQRVNSPLLVVLVAIYALKITSSLLLPESGLEQFFYQFIDLPTSLILTPEPLLLISQLPIISTVVMYVIGAICLLLSLSIQKHGELQLSSLWRG